MGAQVTVLTNPTAGAGRADRVAAAAVDQLRRRGLPVAVIWGRNALHAAELAQASVERSDAALVVVGGDGMVHLAAQVLTGTSMPLGVVPAGSGNDVARMLGLPQHSAAGAADVIADALVDRRIGSVDVAAVSAAGLTAQVVSALATGFDARVNERAARMRAWWGRSRYAAATVAELGCFTPLQYSLRLDGVRTDVEAILVAVCNGPTYGGGLPICPPADPRDGLLDVVIVEAMSTAQLLRATPRLLRGTHTHHRSYQHLRARSVSIEAADVVTYGDGERLTSPPMAVTVQPGALQMLAR